MKKKRFSLILVELVLLAAVVGFIPELLVGGFTELIGVCGFSARACHDLQLQGSLKIVMALICSIFAVVVGFVISDKFDEGA